MRQKKNRRAALRGWGAAALLWCALLGVSAGAAEPGVGPSEIVIAQVAPLTGVLAGANRESVAGALAYFSLINAGGGVHGRKIVLRQLDDEQNADKALELTRAVIAGRAAFAFFMHRTSPTLQKTVPEATRAGYPVVAPQVGPTFVYEPANPLVFNVRARYRDEVSAIVRHLHTLGLTSIGFFFADDAFGKDNMAGAHEAMKALGLKPAGEISFDNRTVDVEPAVAYFGKLQPNAVVMIASPKAAAQFVIKMRASKAEPLFVSLSNTSGEGYLKDLGAGGDGVMVTQVMPYPFSDSSPIAREFRKVMRERSKAAPTYATLQGYISAKVLVEGLRRAGPRLTQRGFVQALEATGELDLGGYRVAYGPGARDGSRYVDITMIRQGRFLR